MAQVEVIAVEVLREKYVVVAAVVAALMLSARVLYVQ
jgi:hypothetical protein